jgi:hypothetical protein
MATFGSTDVSVLGIIAGCCFLVGVFWWIILRGYELHFRDAPRPLHWLWYLPADIFFFAPVLVVLYTIFILVSWPWLLMPASYRESWWAAVLRVLYPLLVGWACLHFFGASIQDAALITIVFLLFCRRGMDHGQRGLYFNPVEVRS